MDTTEKLLRIPEKVEKETSFLYLSEADICPCKRDEWLDWIRSLVKSEKPDFVYSPKACTADIGCEVITPADMPLFFDKGGVHYIVLPDVKTEAACSAVQADLEVADKKLLFLNVELHAKVNALACVYGGEDDYALYHNNILYMSTAATPYGGVRSVSVDVNGQVTSEMFYFADKREQVYKTTWKTVLECRGSEGRPTVDGEYVYIPTADDGYPKACGVYKLDGRGCIIWKCSTENSVNSDVAIGDQKIMAVDCQGRAYFICKDCGKVINKVDLHFEGKYARVTMTCLCGVAYVSINGKILAVDIENEKILWENAESASDTEINGPTIIGKLLVCGNKDGVFALCRKTGQRVWANSSITSSRRGARPLSLTKDRILLSAGDTIYLLNGESGEILGGKRVEGLCFDLPSQPLLRGGLLYLAAKDNGVVTVDVSELLSVEEKSEISVDEVVGSYMSDEKKSLTGDILYLDGYLTFTTADGYMYMVNVATGELKKNLNTLSAVKTSPSYVRLRKVGRTAMEAFIVTSSLCGKMFGNRL